MIGEALDDQGEVMGAVVSVRRAQDKIAVWTRWSSAEHEDTIKRIGCVKTMLWFESCSTPSRASGGKMRVLPGERA